MEYTGEGHYEDYLKQEHTGWEACKRQQKVYMDEAMAALSANISGDFRRYEHNTSSPSDPTSVIFGIYHSPISKMHVTSNVRKIKADKCQVTVVKATEWGIPVDLQQYSPATPMLVQASILTELLHVLAGCDESAELGNKNAIAVHLEVGPLTYRALITIAEKYGLRFRFFPTPAHAYLDKYRAACELSDPMKAKGEDELGGHTISFVPEKQETGAALGSQRYHVVAYCPSCAKLLLPEGRLQCSQCKIAFYCNAECQKRDWRNLHKKECKKFSKLINEADCEYCKKV